MLFDKVDLIKRGETTNDLDEKENLYKEIDNLSENSRKYRYFFDKTS